MSDGPQDHVRSFDAALDRVLGVACGWAALGALIVIAGVVLAIVKFFTGGMAQ